MCRRGNGRDECAAENAFIMGDLPENEFASRLRLALVGRVWCTLRGNGCRLVGGSLLAFVLMSCTHFRFDQYAPTRGCKVDVRTPGNEAHPPLEDAPGGYVLIP